MLRPMEGVRVLEVAQFTFVPSAGAVLADWGADVIKIEHAEKGDAQRGLVRALGHDVTGKNSFAPIMDGPNRGKRSLGLSLEKPEARRVLEDLIKSSDVFLTNFLPEARRKLGIEVEDIRAINPKIIYAVGSAFGYAGPEAEKGGYDGTAFWSRSGGADTATPLGYDGLIQQPGGAYGDNLGGMTIAGGIAAALFHRERTGETSTVDISLLGVGAWAGQMNIGLALMAGGPLPKYDPKAGNTTNPLTGTYKTKDGRYLNLVMLQPGRYWPDFVEKIGHPELATDERFDSAEKLMQNSKVAAEIVSGIIAEKTKDEWLPAFTAMEGQWAVVQNSYEVGNDPQLVATGNIADITDAEGNPRKLITNPVHFNRQAPKLTRGPLFAEHTDEILAELGLSDEEAIQLKIAGAVT